MHPGEMIAERFVIDRFAGKGGMGSVYRALDRESGEPVALKVLLGERVGDHTRFENEVRLLAELEHPGIVRYIAHGQLPDGAPYLVMEWVDGENLATRLARLGLGISESVALVRAAADALVVLHGRGMVHRDLKPSNLMLVGGAPLAVKLVDFGVAWTGRASARLTNPGILIGTPGYMAPEQAGENTDIDVRADVFALGCVLFECLTGRPAFVGHHVMALLAKVLMEVPARVDDLRPEVPAALALLVARMLSKDRAERPADAAALVAEIDQLGELEGTLGPSVPRRAEALTGSEQQLLCVIVAAEQRRDATSRTSSEARSNEVSGETREQLVGLVSPLGARISALAFGGFLVTLEGKGSVAEQAARAARCALYLRQRLPSLSMVLVTGRGERGTLVGPILDRAGKMLAARETPDVGVRVDDITRALLDVRFDLTGGEAGWELIGERTIGEEVRTLLGRPTPFVGRDREMRMLLELVEESAGEGVARAALVTAPPGMGKSRVRHEIVQRVRQQHPETSIWQGRGDALSAGSAFALLGSALRHAAGIAGGEPLPARLDLLRARVSAHVAATEQARVAAFLGEIAGAPFPDEEHPKLRAARQSTALMADQIRLAFLDFVRAELLAQPVILMLEDIHWGDLPSLKLIDRALREAAEQPLLAFALARPEVHAMFPKLWDERGVCEIRLGELSQRSAEALVRHMLGRATPKEQVAALVERGGGNAFYLEELIRAVAEGRGAALPETVLGLVEARLLSLEPEARRLLRAASVFGEAFWEGGVVALLGGDLSVTLTSSLLAALAEREVILCKERSRFPGEREFVFRHALLREGAYAMLSEGDRGLGHKLAAGWLEQAGEGDPMVLAEHFERGNEPARAAVFYVRAAEQALRGQDCVAAIDRAERAIRCGARDDTRALALSMLTQAHMFNGDTAQSLAYANQTLAATTPGSLFFCSALAYKVISGYLSGQFVPLMEAMPTLHSVEPKPEGAAAFAGALALVTVVLFHGRQFPFAEAFLERAKRLGEPLAEQDPSLLAWLSFASAEQRLQKGDEWTARALFQRAAASFAEAGEYLYRVPCLLRGGFAALRLGAYAEAQQACEQVLESGNAVHLMQRSASIYLIFCRLGRGPTEAVRADALALCQALAAENNQTVLAFARMALSQVHLGLGDLGAAEREARLALDVFPENRLEHMVLLATLVEVRIAEGRPEDALSLAEKAMASWRSLPPAYAVHARVPLVYAEALEATGDHARAGEVIAAARAGLLARAERVSDPAMRRSFLEAVPEHARIMAWRGVA